jgi:ferric-dicitrate binding protein FerR (iron transport regulator)
MASMSTAVLMHGEDVVLLAPFSTILLRETNGKNGMTRLEQTLGNIIVKVEKRPGWNFQVETPYLTAVVKGTKFGVSVDGNGARVDVRQGVVGVSDYSGHRADVGAGQTCSVTKGGAGVLVAPSPREVTKPLETIAK